MQHHHATPAKLRDGSWGARIVGADALDGDRGGLARMHQRLRAAIAIKAGRITT